MDLLKNLITPHFSSPLLHTPPPAKRAHQRGLGPLKSHPRSPSVCLSKEPDSTAQPELTRRNSNTRHTSLPPAAVCPNKPHTDHNNYQAVNHVTHLSTKPHNVCTSHPTGPVEQPGFRLVPLGDANVAGSSIICYTTALPSPPFSSIPDQVLIQGI